MRSWLPTWRIMRFMEWRAYTVGLGLILVTAAAFMYVAHRGDDLSAFRPFQIKDERRFYGQNEFYCEGIPPDSPPCEVETLELDNITSEQVHAIIKTQFEPLHGWKMSAAPYDSEILFRGSKPWTNSSKTIVINFRRPGDKRPVSRSAEVVVYRVLNPVEAWAEQP